MSLSYASTNPLSSCKTNLSFIQSTTNYVYIYIYMKLVNHLELMNTLRQSNWPYNSEWLDNWKKCKREQIIYILNEEKLFQTKHNYVYIIRKGKLKTLWTKFTSFAKPNLIELPGLGQVDGVRVKNTSVLLVFIY